MPAKTFPEKLIEQAAFFKKYNIEVEAYRRTGLKWSDLRSVYADFVSWRPQLLPVATSIFDTLALGQGVHAGSQRVKDPEHVVEKIIRRSLEQESPWATPGNYRVVIRDLIGVRALHLFKEDWRRVDSWIKENWRLTKKPVAKVRKTDPQYILDEFRGAGCKIEVSDSGYRSVHYEFEAAVAKVKVGVELQARTLFEEAWGEISHQVQYPYFRGALLLENYLIALSRIAGMGDNVSSAVSVLREMAEAVRSRKPLDVRKEISHRFDLRLDHIKEQPPPQNDLLCNPALLEGTGMKAMLTPK